MKLSEFILKVIRKCREFGEQKPYLPDSSEWHQPRSENGKQICFACLAGIYAAAERWVTPQQSICPGDDSINTLTHEQEFQINALECVRNGLWDNAQDYLGIPQKQRIGYGTQFRPTPPKHRDFYGWKAFQFHLDSLEDKARQLAQIGH